MRSSRPKTRSWLLFCSTTQKYVGGNRITLSYQYHSCYCYYYDMLFQKQISALWENVQCTLQLLPKTDLQCSMYHKKFSKPPFEKQVSLIKKDSQMTEFRSANLKRKSHTYSGVTSLVWILEYVIIAHCAYIYFQEKSCPVCLLMLYWLLNCTSTYEFLEKYPALCAYSILCNY